MVRSCTVAKTRSLPKRRTRRTSNSTASSSEMAVRRSSFQTSVDTLRTRVEVASADRSASSSAS